MQSRMIVSAAGVLLVGWLPTLPPAWSLIAAALCCAVVYGVYRPAGKLLFALSLGLAYGVGFGALFLQSLIPSELESEALQASVLVLEPPQRRWSSQGLRQRFSADVELTDCERIYAPCERGPLKVWLSYYGDDFLRAGERWRGVVTLKRPRGLANPGSFNREAWLAERGYIATGYLHDSPLGLLEAGRGSWIQRWRQELGERLRDRMGDGSAAGVLLALTTGDRSALSRDDWQRFQRYGMTHLVVISGLHVGLVAGLGFLLGRPFGRWGSHAGALVFACTYSALAGFTLPTVRALAMLCSVQIVGALGRRAQPSQGLSLALLVVALIDPLASHSAGFWLSFGAVCILFYVRHMWPQLEGWRLALVLQCLLAPCTGLMAAYWYGGMGMLAPLVNLIAIPIVGFWMAPLCLAAAVLPLLDGMLWDLASLPVHGFLAVDDIVSASLSPWLRFRPSTVSMVAGLLAILWSVSHRSLPLRWLALPGLALLLFPTTTAMQAGSSRLTVLDVGQGLSAVLIQPDFTMVYDTGDGDPEGTNMAEMVIIPFLERANVSAIDLLVISHADRDHASGLTSLQRRFEIGEIWLGEPLSAPVLGARRCRAGINLRRANLDIKALWPPSDQLRGNDSSCVLRLRAGDYRLLLPGDITAQAEYALIRRYGSALQADAVLLPHHGSVSSTTSALLHATRPELTLLSRGDRNRFGHPHPQVQRRLAAADLVPCDTAEQGAVTLLLRNGEVPRIERWRERKHYYWQGIASPACGPAYNAR